MSRRLGLCTQDFKPEFATSVRKYTLIVLPHLIVTLVDVAISPHLHLEKGLVRKLGSSKKTDRNIARDTEINSLILVHRVEYPPHPKTPGRTSRCNNSSS